MIHPDRVEGTKEPYRMPERAASATVHFTYGFSEPTRPSSVEAYLGEKKFALIADLLSEGLTPGQIEEAVNSGKVRTAPVFKARITDLFWDPEAEGGLEELAAAAQASAGGDGSDPNSPIGADVVSLGGTLESQQLALAALAYAAHKGMVVETSLDRGMGVGPMFVSSANPMSRLIIEALGTPEATNS